MKITMISMKDFSASGWKTCEAIKRHTDHDIELFAKRHNHSLGHPHGTLINDQNIKWVQDRVDKSDIIHVKGDWPAIDGYMGLKISHKPIVQTVSGGLFRKRIHGGLEKVRPEHYKLATLKTAMTPDLCYPEYSDIWTPHPIDSEDVEIAWKPREVPLLIHSTVNRARSSVKGTAFIMDVLAKVSKQVECKIELVQGVSYEEAIKRKKEATIFFDQFRVGFYGNSAIEAMQFGIPVCAWISPKAEEQSDLVWNDCPVISLGEKNPQEWAETILYALEHNMTELSQVTKDWCDNVHGYSAVAKQWDKLYNLL